MITLLETLDSLLAKLSFIGLGVLIALVATADIAKKDKMSICAEIKWESPTCREERDRRLTP